MQYDPIKRKLGKVFNTTPSLRKLFYRHKVIGNILKEQNPPHHQLIGQDQILMMPLGPLELPPSDTVMEQEGQNWMTWRETTFRFTCETNLN